MAVEGKRRRVDNGGGSLDSTDSMNPPSQCGHVTVDSDGNLMKRVHL